MAFRLPRLTRSTARAATVGLALVVLVSACSTEFISQNILTTEPEANGIEPAGYGLYLTNGNDYPVDETASALAEIDRSPGGDRALVIFVHGMGDYPGKAYRWETLARMEEQYPADVLMLHWPSWIDFRTIPRGNAAASGAYLGAVLEQLQAALAEDEDLAARPRILLLHSLGAEVLRGFLEDYDGGLRSDLLDSVVLAAPEVDLAGHADWLERLDFATTVYVLQNENDRVLNVVKLHENEARLGMHRTHLDGREEPLASNAVYIDIGPGSRRHRYFVQRQSACLAAIFDMIAEGDPTVTRTDHVELVQRPNVYVVTN